MSMPKAWAQKEEGESALVALVLLAAQWHWSACLHCDTDTGSKGALDY